jgi:hypothetical protein
VRERHNDARIEVAARRERVETTMTEMTATMKTTR